MTVTPKPVHCVPERKLSQPELERAIACLGPEIEKRDTKIAGLQGYARDVSTPADAKK